MQSFKAIHWLATTLFLVAAWSDVGGQSTQGAWGRRHPPSLCDRLM